MGQPRAPENWNDGLVDNYSSASNLNVALAVSRGFPVIALVHSANSGGPTTGLRGYRGLIEEPLGVEPLAGVGYLAPVNQGHLAPDLQDLDGVLQSVVISIDSPNSVIFARASAPW